MNHSDEISELMTKHLLMLVQKARLDSRAVLVSGDVVRWQSRQTGAQPGERAHPPTQEAKDAHRVKKAAPHLGRLVPFSSTDGRGGGVRRIDALVVDDDSRARHAQPRHRARRGAVGGGSGV